MDNDAVNPFQPPVSSVQQPTTAEHSNEQTAILLRQTRPWTMTIGVLMIISSLFMVVAAMGMIVASSFTSGANGMPVGFTIGLAAFYLVLAGFYIVPAVLLIKYSNRISDYVASPDTSNLNQAIRTQKSFWKFCGIGALVMIGLYVLFIVGMVFVGFSASM